MNEIHGIADAGKQFMTNEKEQSLTVEDGDARSKPATRRIDRCRAI